MRLRVVVLTVGIALIASGLMLLLVQGGTASRDQITYWFMIAYITYLVSSAALSFADPGGRGSTRASQFLVLMLPITLAVSWPPVTVALPKVILRQTTPLPFVAITTAWNLLLTYVVAWVTVLVRGERPAAGFTRRAASMVCGILLPIVLWILEISASWAISQP